MRPGNCPDGDKPKPKPKDICTNPQCYLTKGGPTDRNNDRNKESAFKLDLDTLRQLAAKLSIENLINLDTLEASEHRESEDSSNRVENETAVAEAGGKGAGDGKDGKCPSVSSAGSTILRNKQQGDAFRDEIADILRRSGKEVVTDATHKNLLTYWTPYGIRTLDIGVWRDSGGLDYIETKSGNAKYEGDQVLKDDWLRGHGLVIDVCFEK